MNGMIVVADTTPINYLILIEQIDVLPKLYGRVVVPHSVCHELMSANAPVAVKAWMVQPPEWLDIRTPSAITEDAALAKLDDGERDAILLAMELAADQLIVDEVAGRREAERRNLPVIGTIGVLREAAEMGLLDLREAFARLQQTSFHISPAILARILNEP